MTGPKNALTQWQARGLHQIMLPTGAQVKVRIPSPEAVVGQLPSELRRLALQFSTSNIDLSAASEEELENIVRFTGHLVCETLREVWNDETDAWEAVHLKPEQLHELELPEEDLTALQQIAGRGRTPAQIDATSRQSQGQLSPARAEQIVREEAAGTVDAYAPFRDQPGRPGDDADGKPVRSVARQRVSRNRGSAAGAAG